VSDAIHVQGVHKAFGELRAVDGIDFRVPVGSLCGFLGPNGAGKSTTIRMIMSIIYPDSGSISVLDGSALDRKDAIGYLPEERGVYRKMPVGQFIRYIARLKGVPGRGLTERIDEWLERMELPGVRKKKCQELSKGMQQKVQFIASVIHEPELIILDEPFSGLDPVNARLLGRTIRSMNDEGRTIIFSTHVLHQAEQLCDRVIMMNKGRMVLDDQLDTIRERHDPRTLLVRTGADPAEFKRHAEAIDGIRSIRPGEGPDVLEISLDEHFDLGDGIPSRLVTELNAAGPMRTIEIRTPSLDDVFVKLVGSSVERMEEEAMP
jgi:ABC-2 type transport system ATP-binding protein